MSQSSLKDDGSPASTKLITKRHGNGPRRVVCLHGFPDDPGTFSPLIPTLTDKGATVVTPYMRGYGPSTPSPRSQYRPFDLGNDVLRVMDAHRWDEAVIVGHDWGAFAAYMAAVIAPERVKGVVAIAVPPPMQFLRGLRFADQRRRSSYMAFFQLGRVAEAVFANNDFKALDELWAKWSPNLTLPREHIVGVKSTFTYPHTVHAALSYYRQLLPWGPTGWIPWLKSYNLAMTPITRPCLILHGATDGCIGPELFEGIHQEASPAMRVECHPGSGHFLHWEDPEWTLNHIQGFLDDMYS